VAQGITTMRSYQLTTLAIVQSPSQLFSLYGPDSAKTLLDNFGCAVFFTPGARAFDVAEDLSNLLGNRTQRARSLTRRRAFSAGGDSESFSDQRRPLMLPQEILTMSSHALIVRAAGCRPVKGEKLIAATDRLLRRRYREAPVPPALPIEPRWAAPGNQSSADAPAGSTPGPSPSSQSRTQARTQEKLSMDVNKMASAPADHGAMHGVGDADLDQLQSLEAVDFSYQVDVDLGSAALDDVAAEQLIERIWQQVSADPALGHHEPGAPRAQA
jgi:type IV secretory pathway TraG/TraD family ATPase VirD4